MAVNRSEFPRVFSLLAVAELGDPTLAAVGVRVQYPLTEVSDALKYLESRGLVTQKQGHYALTTAGEEWFDDWFVGRLFSADLTKEENRPL